MTVTRKRESRMPSIFTMRILIKMRIPLRFFATVSLATAVALPASTQTTQSTQLPRVVGRDSLQRIVRDRVASGRAKGLIIGVLTPDGGRYVVAAGNERAGKALNELTIFEIGSITKVFTGILLADMVGRGEVRLDQPVAELLPKSVGVPSRNGRVITLGDLSSQISGLPRLPDNMRPADSANPYADYSVAQLYEFLGRYQLPRDPGAQYEYSNLGVGLLGQALALRAGTSYEALVHDRILAPLGMLHTAITLSPDMRAHVAEGHDAGGAVVPLWDLPTLAGAGALRSSLDDMLLFLEANRSPSADPIGLAITRSHQARFRVNDALSLGLNWHISNFRDDTLIWHNGGTAGFRTLIGWNPRTRAGAVLLGNSSQDNEDIVRHLLMGAPLATLVMHKEISVAPEALAAYVGTYEFSPQFAITITLENGALHAQATEQPKFPIFAEAKDLFFLKIVDAQLEFTRDTSGAVSSVTLIQGGRSVGRRVR